MPDTIDTPTPQPNKESAAAARVNEILTKMTNTVALGIMGNVPGSEGTPVYLTEGQPEADILALINSEADRRLAEFAVELKKQMGLNDASMLNEPWLGKEVRAEVDATLTRFTGGKS